MGVYITLVDNDLNETGLVDFGYSGDKQFWTWVDGLPYESHPDVDGADAIRPLLIDKWRAALPPDRPNPDRFPAIFDLLEARKDLWLYTSW